MKHFRKTLVTNEISFLDLADANGWHLTTKFYSIETSRILSFANSPMLKLQPRHRIKEAKATLKTKMPDS